MAVPIWVVFTRGLHGFASEASRPFVDEEVGGCMRKTKTKTQGGKDEERYGCSTNGNIKAEYALNPPYVLFWFPPLTKGFMNSQF